MTNPIIPQEAVCRTCHGKRGFEGPDGFEPCADCNVGPCASIPERNVPIVNLCSSGFVAALERTTLDITALAHLEGFLAILEELRTPVKCIPCEGIGNLPDPFEEVATEICPYCKGKGKAVPAAYSSLIGDNRFAALKTLVTDLRAAYEAAQGASS